jgi:uncharacterized membrane protein (GlpM family)
MLYIIAKFLITTGLIVLISEVSKRSTALAALLASLPLTSVLAMLWLYIDTKDIQKVAALADSILWLVIPSLFFFISFPLLLKKGVDFYLSMGIAAMITAGCYFLMQLLLSRYGIKL